MAAHHGDVAQLLHLLTSAPRMSPYLIDPLLTKQRARLAAALSAFSPVISLTFAAEQLGFDTLHEVIKSSSFILLLAQIELSATHCFSTF